MKIKVEVDIDWIDEESNIDEEINDRIIREVVAGIKNMVGEQIKKEAEKTVSEKLDQWILDKLNEFCDRRIAITDKWGDAIEHHESVTEMFKAKFDTFFNATVTKDGKEVQSCNYGSNRFTRIDFLLNQKAEAYLKEVTDKMDREIKRVVDAETQKKIREKIQKHVIDKVAETIS